jgi:spermidine synthase
MCAAPCVPTQPCRHPILFDPSITGVLPAHSDRRAAAALPLMLVSGVAGLGYQVVWTQQFSISLGHELAAVLAVVAAFFGGMAVGAFALARRIDRSRYPARWYAGCEITVAAWSVALAAFAAPMNGALLMLIGAEPSPAWHWGVTFCGSFMLLLPATAAMGATLPAMERLMATLRSEGPSIGALYAANTLGAVIGVLGVAFFALPRLGLSGTASLCAGLNVACALAAISLFGRVTALPPLRVASERRARHARLFATGILGIGYEVVVVRVLSQVAEDTVFTFAMLLAVYLIGTAAGAAFYQTRLSRTADADRLRDRLLGALAAACLLGALSLWVSDDLKQFVLQTLGLSFGAALFAEAVIAAAAFALPTIAMGALFSHLCVQARAAGGSFGAALGVNTLGAALAPLLFGVLVLPALGPKAALMLVAFGYLALMRPRAWRRRVVWAPAGAAAVLAALAPPLAFVELPEGARVLSYRDGVMAAVSVVEDAQGVRRLRIDNRQQEGSSASGVADARQAMLPMLLHPAPTHALFLGLGTGVTAAAAAQDASLQVDAVELLPEVIAASSYFSPAPAMRLPHIMAADARRFVRATPQHYDLVVADLFHPARSGAGALYTVEHFQAVRARLAPGGLFCQWLPLHQLDLDTLRSIVQSFVTVYPNGWALLATHSLDTPVVGLVARPDAARFGVAQVRERLARFAPMQQPEALGITDEFALLGSFIAGPKSLSRFAGGAPANTDDRPIVVYRAPRITYAPDSMPRDRLVALLRELELQPAELVGSGADDAWQHRLAAYWAARSRFIEVGRDVRPTGDASDMLAQVRAPLMSIVRSSADFRPAYDPLLRMAMGLARSDIGRARAVLAELQAAQPARAEAALAYRQLGEQPP